MKIGFGCDHAAIDLKNELVEYMKEKGYECVDYGTGYDENGEYDDRRRWRPGFAAGQQTAGAFAAHPRL